MKISYNAAAMRASNALNASDSKVSKSLGRLSSGLKVTASKDNPSGYAIGRRMNTQITGLSTATQSSKNGISIIETADGALTEVHEMLQRMNELAVKGETGTLTTSDRMTLEAEVKQLKQEITRISTDTQFNGQTLLDGTFDLRGYTNNHKVKVDYYSDEVTAKKYEIQELTVFYDENGKIDKDATIIKLASSGDYAFPAGVEISETTKNKITLKGPLDFEMTLEVEPPEEFPGSVILAGKRTTTMTRSLDFQVPYTYNEYKNQDGSSVWIAEIENDLTKINDSFQKALNSDTNNSDYTSKNPGLKNLVGAEIKGIDYKTTGKSTLTIEGPNFNKVININTRLGQQNNMPQPLTGTVRVEYYRFSYEVVTNKDASLIIDATGIGTMDIQTGANEGQQLAIRIPTISLGRMNLEDLKMTTEDEAADANRAIKSAILYVSDARSRLGAYQNRLEHTVNNLAVSSENMTASYSRIMDVDMAEEMTNYTTEQVISQAAVSMLAQANERPSQVLQLLQ